MACIEWQWNVEEEEEVCVCVCVCTCRMSHDISGKSPLAGTVILDSQQLFNYKMITLTPLSIIHKSSSNLTYSTVTEPSNQPVPQDDHTYSIVDRNQQETVVTSGNPAYAISLRPAANDGDNPAYSNTSRSFILITQYQ